MRIRGAEDPSGRLRESGGAPNPAARSGAPRRDQRGTGSRPGGHRSHRPRRWLVAASVSVVARREAGARTRAAVAGRSEPEAARWVAARASNGGESAASALSAVAGGVVVPAARAGCQRRRTCSTPSEGGRCGVQPAAGTRAGGVRVVPAPPVPAAGRPSGPSGVARSASPRCAWRPSSDRDHAGPGDQARARDARSRQRCRGSWMPPRTLEWAVRSQNTAGGVSLWGMVVRGQWPVGRNGHPGRRPSTPPRSTVWSGAGSTARRCGRLDRTYRRQGEGVSRPPGPTVREAKRRRLPNSIDGRNALT